MEKNQRRRRSLDQDRTGNVGGRVESGLEIEAGFKIWIEWIRKQAGDPRIGEIQFASDAERIHAITIEESLLTELASEWNAGAYLDSRIRDAQDITKGSEHHVIRYTNKAGSIRVLKATFPGKYGRYEYSPTIYLNSLRWVQSLVPNLDIRIHGIIRTERGPSVITSMRYITGRHPRPAEIAAYLSRMGWSEYHDGSQTLDFVNETLGQIIRDGHANNWVCEKESGLMVPIDISIESIRK